MRRLLSLWIILSSIGFASAVDDLKFVAVDLQPHATQKRYEGLGSTAVASYFMAKLRINRSRTSVERLAR